MRTFVTMAALFVMSASAFAQAPKPCEDLKAEIAKKLDAKNVKTYSLEIVAKDDKEGDGKVVGTCDGGSKKIVYSRASAPAQSATATAATAPTKP
jgi:hypothetical protein